MKTKQTLRNVILLSTTFATLLSSCKKEAEIRPEIKKEPDFTSSIKIGQQSIFQATGNFGNGIQTIKNFMTVKTVENSGNNIFKAQVLMPMFNVIDTMIIEVTPTGVFEQLKEGGKKLIASKDPKIGDVSFTVSGRDTTFRKVMEIDASVTVPAGNFNCIKIKEYHSGNHDYSIECIDKGLIKVEQFGSMPIKIELSSRNY